MAGTYDAIIIGGGHNGLVTACYLAKAKWKVLVLERRYLVGGACVTEETFPGFKVSTAAYVNSLFRPEIVRELRLADYGFASVERNPSSFSPFMDGRYGLRGFPSCHGRNQRQGGGLELCARRHGRLDPGSRQGRHRLGCGHPYRSGGRQDPGPGQRGQGGGAGRRRGIPCPQGG